MANKRRPLAERRARIFDCAVELFAQRGFRRASTREIARMAGVKEPIVFRAFGNKAKLIDECLDVCARRIGMAVNAMVKTSSLAYLLDNYYDIYASHEDEHVVLYYAAAEASGARERDRIRRIYVRLAGEIADMLPRSTVGAARRSALAWLLISIGHFYIVRKRCGIAEADAIAPLLGEIFR